jgi:hypothetical protein
MVRKRAHYLLPLLLMLLQSGCGGSTSFKSALPANGNVVTLTMKDAPPTNVTVLSFRVTLTGAVLNPGNINLLASTGLQDIDVEKLQAETAFISTASVPANSGPITSLSLTFANPELTIINGTGNTIANCSPGPSPCQVKPTGVLLASVNFSPALNLATGSSAGLLVDLNVNNIITGSLGVDFGSANSVTVAATVAGSNDQSQDMNNVDEITGKITNKGTASFDLQTDEKVYAGIQVDQNTMFSGFTSCTANPANFTCIQNGQAVDVSLSVLASGALVAKQLTLSGMDNGNGQDEELDGTVVSVDAAANKFTFVVSDNLSTMNNSVLGASLEVQIQAGAVFKVDVEEGESNASVAPTFADITAVLPGQAVAIHRLSGDGSSANPLTTDRVQLREAQLTAPVSAKIDANTFSLDVSGNALFKQAGVSTITVDATHAVFEGVPGVGGIVLTPTPDTVAVSGWLFKQPSGTPLLVAAKIRKH